MNILATQSFFDTLLRDNYDISCRLRKNRWNRTYLLSYTDCYFIGNITGYKNALNTLYNVLKYCKKSSIVLLRLNVVIKQIIFCWYQQNLKKLWNGVWHNVKILERFQGWEAGQVNSVLGFAKSRKLFWQKSFIIDV